MTGARILAIASTLSSLCATAGGFLDVPALVGAGGLVMLGANVFVSITPGDK